MVYFNMKVKCAEERQENAPTIARMRRRRKHAHMLRSLRPGYYASLAKAHNEMLFGEDSSFRVE